MPIDRETAMAALRDCSVSPNITVELEARQLVELHMSLATINTARLPMEEVYRFEVLRRTIREAARKIGANVCHLMDQMAAPPDSSSLTPGP